MKNIKEFFKVGAVYVNNKSNKKVQVVAVSDERIKFLLLLEKPNNYK